MNFLKNFFLKNDFSKNNIPRRPLTIESTTELSNTLQRVVADILSDSCPCRHPRFRYLVNFQDSNYDAGPVFCADTNYLVSAACHDSNFLLLTARETSDVIGDYAGDLMYTCQKCGSVYKRIGKQYSINFEFQYLIIVEPKHEVDTGAEVKFPIPLLQGLFGFSDSEILKCAKDFKIGTTNEVFNYLTERK